MDLPGPAKTKRGTLVGLREGHGAGLRRACPYGTRMRLVPESNEVRALDEQWEVTWVGDTSRLARSREYSRGQVTTVSRQWEIKRGSDGRLHKTEVFRFDPAEMKAPLQNAILGAGWTWRGVVFKL